MGTRDPHSRGGFPLRNSLNARDVLGSAGSEPPLLGAARPLLARRLLQVNHSAMHFERCLDEAGERPKYVMQQMGHADPGLALQMYAKIVLEGNTMARKT